MKFRLAHSSVNLYYKYWLFGCDVGIFPLIKYIVFPCGTSRCSLRFYCWGIVPFFILTDLHINLLFVNFLLNGFYQDFLLFDGVVSKVREVFAVKFGIKELIFADPTVRNYRL